MAAVLEAARPGAALALTLEGLEVADVDDAALIETVAAWERLASWAAAGQARAIAELAARRPAHRSPFVSDEVAARLTVTRAVAEGKTTLGLLLARLPEVGAALARGDVDVRRATVLTEELARVPEHVAEELAADAVARAVDVTAPQLRARLRRLELLRDPDGAVVRHRRACEQRRVELTPAADAMAWLSAYLPATDAVAVQTTLTALAQDRDREEDARTLDQRRADALVDLATQWLDAGTRPDGGPLTSRQGRAPHLTITATAATVAALADMPAELEGYGCIPAGLARQVAARSTWEPLLLDARTAAPLARSTRRYAPRQGLRDAVVQRDRTCRFPGCRVPARRCDIDHVEPFRDGRTDEPQTRVDNLQALCRHHHRAKTHGGWRVDVEEDGSRRWTAPSGQVYSPPKEPAVLDSVALLESLALLDPLVLADPLAAVVDAVAPDDPADVVDPWESVDPRNSPPPTDERTSRTAADAESPTPGTDQEAVAGAGPPPF